MVSVPGEPAGGQALLRCPPPHRPPTHQNYSPHPIMHNLNFKLCYLNCYVVVVECLQRSDPFEPKSYTYKLNVTAI